MNRKYGLARPSKAGPGGGWSLTLIDSVAGCAGHSLLPAGVGYTTMKGGGAGTADRLGRSPRAWR